MSHCSATVCHSKIVYHISALCDHNAHNVLHSLIMYIYGSLCFQLSIEIHLQIYDIIAHEYIISLIAMSESNQC